MASVVENLDEAIDNIGRYQIEVRKKPELARLMKQVHAWYAIKSDGTWRFGPSKFIGYAETTPGHTWWKRPVGTAGPTEAAPQELVRRSPVRYPSRSRTQRSPTELSEVPRTLWSAQGLPAFAFSRRFP